MFKLDVGGTRVPDVGVPFAVAVLSMVAKAGETDPTNSANANAQNDNDETALMFAARNGAKEVVKVLLAAQANSRLKNRNGQTAMDLARAGRHSDTAKELAKARS